LKSCNPPVCAQYSVWALQICDHQWVGNSNGCNLGRCATGTRRAGQARGKALHLRSPAVTIAHVLRHQICHAPRCCTSLLHDRADHFGSKLDQPQKLIRTPEVHAFEHLSRYSDCSVLHDGCAEYSASGLWRHWSPSQHGWHGMQPLWSRVRGKSCEL
jgi:hypothetical protein